MKSTTIVQLLTLIVGLIVVNVSSYSDTDFLQSISKQFNPSLIEKHFKDTIKRRISTINTIRSDYNLTDDQIAFCNITQSTLIMFNDYIDSSIPSFQTCGFASSDRLKHFINQYEIIINLWREEFKSSSNLVNQLVEVDYETPETLIQLLENQSKSVNWIKEKVLHSIERYKSNVELFYQEISRYESTLADSTIKQLSLLQTEVQQLNVAPTIRLNSNNQPTSSSTVKALRLALERFKLIVKLFSCSRYL